MLGMAGRESWREGWRCHGYSRKEFVQTIDTRNQLDVEP